MKHKILVILVLAFFLLTFVFASSPAIVIEPQNLSMMTNDLGINTSYVPYLGAIDNVDLGIYNLTANKLFLEDAVRFGNEIFHAYSNNLVINNDYNSVDGQIFEVAGRIGANFSDDNSIANPSATSLIISTGVNDASSYYFIDGLTIETITKDSGSTIGSIAALYIQDQTNATNNWAIATNLGNVYHGDSVLINPSATYFDPTRNPNYALEVIGNITASGDINTSGKVLGGWNSSFGNGIRYFTFEELDLSGLGVGSYPMLVPYTDGVLGNYGVMANSMLIWDKDDIGSISQVFISNVIGSEPAGVLEYTTSTQKFEFTNFLGGTFSGVHVDGNFSAVNANTFSVVEFNSTCWK